MSSSHRTRVSVLTIVFLAAGFLFIGGAFTGASAALPWTDSGGPDRILNSVSAMAYDSARDILYASRGGVWRCDNPYTVPSWSQMISGTTPDSSYINAMVYDSERNILYMGTSVPEIGPGSGVWRCANPDSAPSWKRISGPANLGTTEPRALAFDSARNILYVGGRGTSWRVNTPSGTASWTKNLDGIAVYSLAYDSTHNILFAGALEGGVGRLKNPDVGTFFTWSGTGIPFTKPTVDCLAYDPTRNVLYGGYADASFDGRGVWRLKNPGSSSTWTSTGGSITGYRVDCLALDTPNNVLYAGMRYPDNGVWSLAGPDTTTGWTDTGGATVSETTMDSLLYHSGTHVLYTGTWYDGAWYANLAPFSIWYLAEGSTNWGFSTYISIVNPNTTPVTAAVTYMTGAGAVSGGDIKLPARSQATVNPGDKLGGSDFSTKVRCREGKPIAVDRTMTWTGPGAATPEAHNSIGVTAPAKTWFLPEGSSAWGFECWLLIQNPNSIAASCKVTYMIEGASPVTKTKTVPANSRETFSMADDIGAKDASIKVISDIPVIPERAMYRNNRREGHDSIGTTAPANDFYLAEGTTAWGFTTYVLVQNPNTSAADVTLTYMTPDGPSVQPKFTMPANSRKTIRVNDTLPGTDLSTKVHGSKPIIAERAMYWGEGTPAGEATHDSIGISAPHSTFLLPDGQTSDGRETWTLVQNPNGKEVKVAISYLTPSGTGTVQFNDTIPANSRKTYSMADKGVTGRAAVSVVCTTAGKDIIVERAMYWNSRGAGTDTIGGFTD